MASIDSLPGMIGSHPSMQRVYRLVRKAAQSDIPAVIVGETGTGKELVARALHTLGPAPDGPFIDLNCAGVPDGIAEAEFFGSERGAFTGAVSKPGMLELANHGTLFLDEACSLSRGLQAKLLRAIEHREFRRVGGGDQRTSRFRLVTAVARPVEDLVATEVFREDFAYRVEGLGIVLPPLRARQSDIRLLAAAFLEQRADTRMNGRSTTGPRRFTEEAFGVLERYTWPGNVRELLMVVERLKVIVADAVITPGDVLEHLPRPQAAQSDPDAVVRVLTACDWDVPKAARALGIGRSTLYQLMKQYSLRRPVSTKL